MNHVVGIAWYEDEEAYERALSVFSDSVSMPATFADWEALVERQREMIREAGNILLRVDFHPEAFRRWCGDRGFEPNASGRVAFVDAAVLEYRKTGRGTVIE